MCCVMACARQNDFTLTMKNKLAEWDVPMCQISSLTTTSDFSSITSSLLFGETLGSTFEEINYFTTSSLKPHQEVFNMGSWLWVLLTPLDTPHNYHRYDTNNLGNFEDCMEGRIRLLTAITPMRTKPSASQDARITFPHQRFRLPSVKAKYPNLLTFEPHHT